MEGIAPPLPPGGNRPAPAAPPLPEPTRGKLRAALGAAAVAIKKGPRGADVEAVARATAASARLDPLLCADVLMDLVHQGKVCDATAAGLAAIPDVILLTAPRNKPGETSAPRPGLAGVLECMRDKNLDPFVGLVDRIVAMGAAGVAAAGGADSAPAAVKAAASAAAATAAALTKGLRRELGHTASALQRADPTSKESVAVATALLRCVPFIAPEEWRGRALGEAVPPLCAHPHPAVRAAAREAMRRAVASTPAARDAIVQGAAGVLLSPPSMGRAGIALTDADVATSAARTLRDVCETWCAAVAQTGGSDSSTETFDPSRAEAAGLLMLCSPSPDVRVAAVEMLREVAALFAALRHSRNESNGRSESPAPSAPSMFSIVESCAGDMVIGALGAEGGTGGIDPCSDPALVAAAASSVAAAGGAAAAVRHTRGGAWTAALGVLASRAAAASPEVTTTARAQALQRVQAVMMQEGTVARSNGPRAPTDSTTDTFEAWRNCTCFVCAASPARETGPPVLSASNQGQSLSPAGVTPNPLISAPTQVALGVRGSLSGLFALLVPCLKEGGAQAAAAAGVLARVPPLAAPQLLAALAPLQGSLGNAPVNSGAPGSGTPFDRNRRDLELRAHLAGLHLGLAVSGAVQAVAPGPAGRDAVAKHLLAFVEQTVGYARSTGAAIECSPDDLNRLLFAAAATATAATPHILSLAPHVVDPEIRSRLWEDFNWWAKKTASSVVDGLGGGGRPGGGRGDDVSPAVAALLSSRGTNSSRGGAGSVNSFDGSESRHGKGGSVRSGLGLSVLDLAIGTGKGGGVDVAALGLGSAWSGSDHGGHETASDHDDQSSTGGKSSAPNAVAAKTPAAVYHACNEAMAALLAGPVFDGDAAKPRGRVLAWIGNLLEGKVSGSRRVDLSTARRALRYHLGANPALAHTVLDACYSSHERTAAAHLSALADLFTRAARIHASALYLESSNSPNSPGISGRTSPGITGSRVTVEPPSCPPAKLVALVLYKLVHPSATVRDDAVALLKSVAALDLGVNDPGGGDGDLHEIFSQDTLPELPDAYQAFQQNVSGTLARRRPALGEELLVEALVRQMDDGAADAGAHRHVLAALAPWTAALHLPHIAAAGRAERLLKSLYFVTFFRGDAFPREMETMWRHIGHSPRNVVPALRFLEMKGLEDTSSATAMSTYCLTAKRVCLYLARAAPQQSIDQLVYAISLRGLEVDYPPGAGDVERRNSGDDSMDMGSMRGSDAGSIRGGSSLGRSNDDDDDDDDDGLKLTAPDLAIILLAEVAAEHDEDFRVHLPVLLHAVVATLAGSPEPTVRAHCRQLLANLTHAIAARPLGAKGRAGSDKISYDFQNNGVDLAHAGLVPGLQVTPGVPGWQGEVGQWGAAGMTGQGQGHGIPGFGADARYTNAYGANLGSNNSGSYGGGGVDEDDDTKGRAAVARLQSLLARPGGGGGAGTTAGGLIGGVIVRGGATEGAAPWTPESIAQLVGLLPDAMVFEPGLREQWADEARRWLLRAASYSLAATSARVLAALRVPLDLESGEALLAALCSSAAAAEGGTVAYGLVSDRRGADYRSSRGGGARRVVSARSASAAADLAGLLLDTLTEMLGHVAHRERDIIEYPHVLWGAAACLRTLHPPLYARAARLFSAMTLAWPLDDPSGASEEILRSAAPVPIGTRFPAHATRNPAVAQAVAAALDAWRRGANAKDFDATWRPPPGMPAPAMSLPDLVPLLLKGLTRSESAAHSARGLAAIVPRVGVRDRWGGERALALATSGLLPLVLAAAVAAEEDAARERDEGGVDPRGLEAAPSPSPSPRASIAKTPTAGTVVNASPGGINASPAAAMAAAAMARARAGPLGAGEGAATGRWLAAGLRSASPRGDLDLLAATLDSVLPSPRARTAVGRGRRYAVAPRRRGIKLPAPPPPPPPGAPRCGRLAEILADPLAAFVFPRHAVPCAKTLVDIAVGQGGENGGDEGGAAAAAALALLTALVTRARGEAAAAVFDPRASGSGSLFAPVASLLDGPHSTPALELLTKVAAGTAAAAATTTTTAAYGNGNDVGDWGPVARLGAPATMWDSVDANGGRAVDLMYGVLLSGGMDPHRAALPACLVSDSADN